MPAAAMTAPQQPQPQQQPFSFLMPQMPPIPQTQIPAPMALPRVPQFKSPDYGPAREAAAANRPDYSRARPNIPLGEAPVAPTEGELQEDSTSNWLAGIGQAMGAAGNQRGLGPILFSLAGGGFLGMAAGKEAQERRKDKYYGRQQQYLDRQGRAEDARSRFEAAQIQSDAQAKAAEIQIMLTQAQAEAQTAQLQAQMEMQRGNQQAAADYQQRALVAQAETRRLELEFARTTELAKGEIPQITSTPLGQRITQIGRVSPPEVGPEVNPRTREIRTGYIPDTAATKQKLLSSKWISQLLSGKTMGRPQQAAVLAEVISDPEHEWFVRKILPGMAEEMQKQRILGQRAGLRSDLVSDEKGRKALAGGNLKGWVVGELAKMPPDDLDQLLMTIESLVGELSKGQRLDAGIIGGLLPQMMSGE
jgi:hypothetical protein